MTFYEWTMGYPWDGNGGAFGEVACMRISLALWTVALTGAGITVALMQRNDAAKRRIERACRSAHPT